VSSCPTPQSPLESMTPRIRRLREAVMSARSGVCPERALDYTTYFRKRANRRKPAAIQMAEALSLHLAGKSKRIHPDELLVGNFSSRRVGGSIYPELHGVVVLGDLLFTPWRLVNRLELSGRDKLRLAAILPFWTFRFLGIRAHSRLRDTLRFLAEQLTGSWYLINESGGVAHIAPDYEKLIRLGTTGLAAEAAERQGDFAEGTAEWTFLEAVRIAAESLAAFGETYARLAEAMARKEGNGGRRCELEEIARTCRRVPRHPARTFREALQSLFFAQIALNLESLDNGISPGRMDQYLWPFYAADLEAGRLTRQEAMELVAAFSIKMSEIVPVFSKSITNFHGGMFNGQVVCIGGTDGEGRDATNELSFVVLEVMDALRMRQPNYHARLHSGTPPRFREAVFAAIAAGANSPALYNDEVVVPTMVANGYTLEDARSYTGIGCVEPSSQGKSLASTDAAIFNVPIRLELALNEGCRFGSRRRSGVKTPPVARMRSMKDVTAAFEAQLGFGLSRLLVDLQAVERANARFHPTPLTSMLLDGCVEKATCSTGGGARYTFSGIQCVGGPDTGDALYAIERLVFVERRLGLPELVELLQKGLEDEWWRAVMRRVPKYGNDDAGADRWTRWVLETFASWWEGRRNTRGGPYTTGLYSVTAHQFFGEVTGPLPSGRLRGEPLASGLSPTAAFDRAGPTAAINSANRIDMGRFANGINFNLKFDADSVAGPVGRRALEDLVAVYFERGGMQVQINVLDPVLLRRAKENPEAYPGLLVRVSGYSAYFADLSADMQDEIIARATYASGAPVCKV